jgi:hypothetical protein
MAEGHDKSFKNDTFHFYEKALAIRINPLRGYKKP